MNEAPSIRPPAVAGRFYPADPTRLRQEVDVWLAAAPRPTTTGRVRAWIAPHAGYLFSGPTAARAYAAAAPGLGRIWLLGPSHHVALHHAAASSARAFATPLGEVATVRPPPGIARIHDAAHAPEHSLETHLPFLQALGWIQLVIPLLTAGEDDPAWAAELDASLADGDVLAVSSDLSHFLGDAQARRVDLATALAIESGDLEAIGPRQACGWVAIRALLRLAARRGWRAERLHLCNSSDTAGDKDRVVGYGAWRFVEAPQ